MMVEMLQVADVVAVVLEQEQERLNK